MLNRRGVAPADVVINVITESSLADRSDGGDLFAMLSACAPELMPRRYGHGEPVNRFDSASIDWETPYVWHGKDRRVSGHVSFALREGRKGWIHLSAPRPRLNQTLTLTLFRSMISRFRAFFAFLHPFTNEETEAGTPGSRDVIVAERDLRHCIPDLYWATYFGRDYVEQFGIDPFDLAAAAIVDADDAGAYIQITPSWLDVETNFGDFHSLREATKRALGRSHFC